MLEADKVAKAEAARSTELQLQTEAEVKARAKAKAAAAEDDDEGLEEAFEEEDEIVFVTWTSLQKLGWTYKSGGSNDSYSLSFS